MTALEYYLSKKWRVTSSYGPRVHPVTGAQSLHHGVDFGIPRGGPLNAPIPTPFAGTVTARGTYGGRGKTVAVRITGTDIVQLFQHLHDYRCKVGDKLRVGDIVGLCGTTGTSTAVHLHYELRYAGNPWGDVWGDPARFKLPGNSGRFYPGAWVEITTSTRRLNVRKSPGGDVVGQLPPGAVQQILDDPDNGIWGSGHHWWRATDGWIAEDWIKLTDAPAEPEPEPPEPEPDPAPGPEPKEPKPRRWPKHEPGGHKRTTRWKREIRKW